MMYRTVSSRFSRSNVYSSLAAALCWLALSLFAPEAASAATYTVTNLNDSGAGSLRAAITLANADSAGVINFQAGLTGTIKLASSLPSVVTSGGSMTINGPGVSVLTISGENLYQILAIEGGTANISGITFTKGWVGEGTGYSGDPGIGGAMAIVPGATLNLQNSVISNSASVWGGGGAIVNLGNLNVTGTTFSGNSSSGRANYAGAIYNVSTSLVYPALLKVSDCTFINNSAKIEGGAILNYADVSHIGATVTISNSTFANNTVNDSGGGIYNFADGTIIVRDSTFSNNLPYQGGGITNAGTMALTNNIFVEQTTGYSACTSTTSSCPAGGGSPDANGNFDDLNSSLKLSSLGFHGGLTQTLVPLAGSPVICAAASTGALDVNGGALTADQRGFALDPSCSAGQLDAGSTQANYLTVTTTADPGSGTCSSTCTLRDAITAGNIAGHADIQFATGVTGTITLGSLMPSITGAVDIVGPGASLLTVSGANANRILSNTGTLSLSGLTLANGNSSASASPSGYAGSGGAILNQGSLSADSVVFSANTGGTTGTGGAIRNAGTLLAVNNSTFSGNSAGASGNGGAIENDSSLTVSNSTFSTNTADSGSAIYNSASSNLTLHYSTIANNTAFTSSAILNGSGATLDASNDTFAGNTGGGIFSSGSSLSVANTILAEAAECIGADCPTSGSGNIYAGAGLSLATLGSYGGPTQTMIPLPGSSVICAGTSSLIPVGISTDQRGFASKNTTYAGYTAGVPCVDAGSVQTNYTAAAFNSTTYTGTETIAGTTPPVIVSVTENVQNIGSVPLTLTFTGTGTATGTSATTVAGTGATFSSLTVNAPGTDSISVSIPVVAGTILTAGPETLTIGIGGTATTAVESTPSPASLTYATSGQSVTLIATVTFTSGGAAVTTGQVLFTVTGTGGTIGTPLSSAVNGSGQASVVYTMPANTPAGSYIMSVLYTDSTGNASSGDSQPFTITQATPAVTAWPTASSITYGDSLSSSTLTGGTADVGGTFAFTTPSSTPNGGTQSVSMTFTPTDAANYNNVTGTTNVTVSKASATVTLGSLSQTYTGSALEATATTTPASLTVDFTYNGVATAPTAAGAYTVVGTINDANYQGTATASLTIAKATPTVIWTPSATITYGTNLASELNASAGYLGSAVIGAFSYTAQPTGGTAVAVTDTSVLPAGSYALQATFTPTDVANYSAGAGSTAITVTQATLTVLADNVSRVYGTANPTFTGSLSGAVNGDTFTEDFSTTATTSSNAGAYSIVPSATGTNLGNYIVNVKNGTLTITQAGTTTSLSLSSGSITPGQSVTLAAQVASATSGAPTGTVSFFDGTTLLNAAAISSGTATYSTTALSAGTTHQISAVYSGDTNFTTSSTSQSTSIAVAALDFTITSTPSSLTVNPGRSAVYIMAVSPLYGSYAGPVTFTLSGLPIGATATFSPSSIAANSGQQNVSMTIQLPATIAMNPTTNPPSTQHLQPLALAFFLLIGIGGMRRHGKNMRRMFYVVVLMLGGAATLLTGCGGSVSKAPPQSYTLTVTATSGNLQHTSTVILNVQ